MDIQLLHKQISAQYLLMTQNVLQMNAEELATYVSEQLQENPFLKELPYSKRSLSQTIPYEQSRSDEYDSAVQIPTQEDELKNELFLQISAKRISNAEKKICRYLVNCLDDRGYLTCTNEELSEELKVSKERIESCIAILQSMDPPGIGARDLRECLLIQLSRLDGDVSLANAIVHNDLELVAERKYGEMANNYSVSVECVETVVQLIKSLQPIPANGYATKERTGFIIPDIIVFEECNTLKCIINDEKIPHIIYDSTYIRAKKEYDDATKAYIREKRICASKLIESIGNREKTLITIVNELIAQQPNVLINKNTICPVVTINDIAKRVQVHPSTISRAVRGKYVRCPRGTIPLRELFLRPSVVRVVGGTSKKISADEVSHSIAEIIACEESGKSLTDENIAAILNASGIQISRRCVAKYRSKMGIVPASKRKHLN